MSDKKKVKYASAAYWFKEQMKKTTVETKFVFGNQEVPKGTFTRLMEGEVRFKPSLVGTVADGAITTAKLADNAVNDSKIAANAVTDIKINAGAVTTTKLADNAVNSTKLADSAATTAKIASGAVDTTKVAADTFVIQDTTQGLKKVQKLSYDPATGEIVTTYNDTANP